MLKCRPLFLPLLFVPLFVFGSLAILQGETVEWTQNAFLAKILARTRRKGDVRSCTGSLVSASLVLTSGHCVVDRTHRNETGKRKMTEFVVILPALSLSNRSGHGQQKGHDEGTEEERGEGPFRSTAKLLATGGREWDEAGGWALLRIVPRNISTKTNCLSNHFARLTVRPSADGPSQIAVTAGELANPAAECQLVGFSTSEKAEEFLTEEKVFRLHLNEVAEPPTDDPFHHYRSRVHKDKHTACYVKFSQGDDLLWDDVGAPLFCKVPSSGQVHVQLGLFQSLTVPLDTFSNKMKKGTAKCRKAREMRFTLLANDQKFAEAIQSHGSNHDGLERCE